MRRNILTQHDLAILAAPIGTKEWAIEKKRRIEEKIDTAHDDFIDLDAEMVNFITTESWRKLDKTESGGEFRTFKEFAIANRPYGLGCVERQFRLIVAMCDASMNDAQREAVNAENRQQGVKHHYNCNDVVQGNDPTYLTARIARDKPDIYAGMLQGKYRSVRSAAIAAKIIDPAKTKRHSLPVDPAAAGAYLAQRVDREWFEQMMDAYYRAQE